jgi:hypothetical protein
VLNLPRRLGGTTCYGVVSNEDESIHERRPKLAREKMGMSSVALRRRKLHRTGPASLRRAMPDNPPLRFVKLRRGRHAMDKNSLTPSTLRVEIETVACDNKNVDRI